MPSPTLHRLVIVGLLSGVFALGCRPVGVTIDPLTELPVARASAVAAKTPAPNGLTGPIPKPDRPVKTAGVAGLVDLGGTPMANADVQLFYAGQSTPFAAGKTGPDGRFSLEIGVIATGGGNVIATGGGNVISVGGGNVISVGGGNAIASGSPLKVIASKDGASLATIASAGVIATGGGNVIATGGGNVISTGGGNVISTGGGNYRVAQASESPSASPTATPTASPTASPTATPTASPTASPSTAPTGTTETKLTLASTLTVVKLGEDLDKAMAASAKGTTLNTESAKSLFAAFKEVQTAAETSLAGASAETRTSLSKAIDSKGKVQPSTLTSLKSLTDALEPVALSARAVLKSVASPKPSSPTPPTVPPASPSLPPSPPPSPSPSPSQGTEFAIFGSGLAQGWTQTGGTLQQGAGLGSGAAIVANYGGSGEMLEISDNAGFFDPAGYNQVRFALKGSQAMSVQVGFFNSGEPIGNPITVQVQTGTYATSTHPFSAFGLTSGSLAGGGISIAFKSTAGPSTLYVDNLLFLP